MAQNGEKTTENMINNNKRMQRATETTVLITFFMKIYMKKNWKRCKNEARVLCVSANDNEWWSVVMLDIYKKKNSQQCTYIYTEFNYIRLLLTNYHMEGYIVQCPAACEAVVQKYVLLCFQSFKLARKRTKQTEEIRINLKKLTCNVSR